MWRLPLAANMIGGTLQRKDIHDWTSVLQSGFSDSNGDTIGVLQVLKLSFHRLPSPLLKKCFAYCSIFSEDEEIEKKRLIQLWMAEGLLVEKDGDDMESLGSRVYDILLINCFFQEAEKNKFGIIKHAEMHDLVHDLACSISKAESFNVENHKSDAIPPRVRNLVVSSLDDHESYKMAIKENAIYLRALFSKDEIPDRVLVDCKNLRTLSLQTVTEELTPSIAKLIHLRFIDVSFTDIRVFPESICKLYNLQTLRALPCHNLRELPNQLRSLTSLRHLVVGPDKDFEMPLQIGKLTCLRTLKFFNVGHENGRQIEELGYLKNLKGGVAICKLEHVNGPQFYYPHDFGVNDSRRRRNNQLAFPALERFILESMTFLQEFPSHGFPCLKELEIKDVKRGLYDNQKIMFMYIVNCSSLSHIKLSAHNLQSLDTIDISSCKKLKSIRYLTQGEEESSGGFISSLQILKVDNCNEVTDILSPKVLESCTSLRTLQVSQCHNLVSFPIDFRSLPSGLRVLDISECPRLRSLPKGGIGCLSGLTKLCIGPFSEEVGLASFYEIFQSGIQQLHSLEVLQLYGWPQFESLPDDIQHLTTLREFRIDNFGMEALPEWIGNLASLRWLWVYRCKRLKQLPSKKALQCLTKLTHLSIKECPELTERCQPYESEWPKISHIPNFSL
ncbi:Disease resistance protein RPS5 [Sesamum angolense]|uniref:Disease resistance protein RPS5 n=1 Tax=Sesamum angolense TaxID=2727404 RepID=A0AAE1XD22_9LAMI|nr:Disease resistance protein RPS5 [Sesamum angolense]